MATSSVAYNKPVLPRVSDTSDLASNRANVYSGKALNFDGVNDYVAVNSFASSLPNTGAWTACGYFKTGGSANRGTWFSAHTSSGGNIIRVGYESGTTLGLFYADSYTLDVQVGNFNFRDNQWHFVALSRPEGGNGTTMTLYIDGAEVATQSVGEIFWSSATQFSFGQEWDGATPTDFFYGLMSNFKMFDVALTAAQVKELYENPEQLAPTGVNPVNLKLWLPMMEGAGSYVYNGSAGATGTELVSNGGFDEVCQKWGLSDVATIAITGGKAVWTNPASGGAFADQYISVSTGKTYRITFDYSASDGGFVYIGNQYTSIPSGNGTFTVDIAYTSGDARLRIAYGSASALTASVDNVSVKEVVPQATGTISGATWVAGVGEPVPQTALIDWNKASNMLTYSEQFDTDWSRAGTSIAVNETAAPNGFFTADKSTVSNTNVYHDSLLRSVTTISGVEYETSIYAKKGNGINGIYFYHGNGGRIAKWNLNDGSYIGYAPSNGYTAYSSYGSESVGNGWFRFWARYTASNTSGNFTVGISPNTDNTVVQYTGDGVSYLYIWGAQYVPVSSTGVTPYVSTAATAQSSPVLLPKGLTASKDILGNAIAKPRSAGAFNFDRASWATLNDNSSVTISGDLTLEGWVNPSVESFSQWETLFSKTSQATMQLFIDNSGILSHYDSAQTNITLSTSSFNDNEWNHFVVVQSGSSLLGYVNGVLEITRSSRTLTMSSAGDLTIGKLTGSADYHAGQIANPRIYNYALTAEQVADNFNQKASTFGKSSVTSELQAYINRTVAAGATVEAHSALLNTLTELENK